MRPVSFVLRLSVDSFHLVVSLPLLQTIDRPSVTVCSPHHCRALVVIGGGAAGFFAAIRCKVVAGKNTRVLLLERSPNCLGKVKISGLVHSITYAISPPVFYFDVATAKEEEGATSHMTATQSKS